MLYLYLAHHSHHFLEKIIAYQEENALKTLKTQTVVVSTEEGFAANMKVNIAWCFLQIDDFMKQGILV